MIMIRYCKSGDISEAYPKRLILEAYPHPGYVSEGGGGSEAHPKADL